MRRFHSWPTWTVAEPALAGRLPAPLVARLGAAYRFAERWHCDQRRPAGEPYVEHLLETLEILLASGTVDAGADPAPLLAALLHDVVEDTPCSLAEVRDAFGAEVAAHVGWLTKPDGGGAGAREAYLRRFDTAPAAVLAVKLSDRYSNVQRLHTHPRGDRQRSYYRETAEWFLPLASRIPFYQRLFADWAEEYRHLSRAGSTGRD
jgi:guanosine-3',5'-bis(diphosphate) 3'-pyrophosphohydrolase